MDQIDFKVEFKGQDIASSAPLASGVAFGYFDRPIKFKVTSSKINGEATVSLNIHAGKNETGEQLNIEYVDGNQIRIDLHSQGAAISGLKNHIALMTVEKSVLGFICRVESNPSTNSYVMFYEFTKGLAES